MLRFLKVQLEAITDGFNNSLRTAQKEAKEFEKTIKPTKQLLKDLGAEATAAGKTLTVAFTAPIAAIAGLGVQFNAMQEQAHIAFTTMLGDGRKAKVFLEDLKDFAARTPFEFPGLVQAAQRLMAMGFAAKDVKPLLESVGNAVAALGGGSAEIDRVTLALGQMQGRGKVATQEMNQLTEVGIPAWRALADGFGVAESKMRDLVEKGLVPADKAIQVLTADMNERFSGMLEKQAKSFSGLMSTIKDETRFLAGELTEGLFNALKGPAETLTARLHELRMSMSGWSDSTKAAIATVAGLAAATGPLLLGLGAVTASLNSMLRIIPAVTTAYNALSLAMAGMFIGPAGLAVAGTVIIAGLVAAFIRYKQETSEVTQRLRIMQKAVDDTVSSSQKLADIGNEVAKSNGRLRIDTDALRIMMEKARREEEQLTLSHRATGEALKGLTVDLKAGAISTDAAASATKKFNLELGSSESETKKAIKNWNDLQEAQERMFESTMDVIAATNQARRELTAPIIEKILQGIKDRAEETARALERFEANMDATIQRLYNNPLSFDRIMGGDLSMWRVRADARTDIFGDALSDMEGIAKPHAVSMGKILSKPADEMSKAFATALGNVTSGLAHALTDSLFKARDFGDAVIGIAKSVSQNVLNALLVGLLSPLTEKLAGLGAQLGGIFGGAGSVAGSVAGSAGSAAGNIGGGVSGAAGSASGLAGALISAGGGVLGGLISGLMGARQEGTLNAVEFNTRAAEIHLRSMIDQILWPIRHDVLAIRESSHMSTTQLDAIYNAISGGGSTSSRVTSASMSSVAPAPTATIQLVNNFSPTLHIDGLPEDWQTIVREKVIPELSEAERLNFRGRLDELIRLLRSSGVVAATA